MDIRNLEYYKAVFEHRNITAAAEKLMVSQQGLSKAIQKLEKEFGQSLFIRTRSGIVPTEFGILFYDEARKMLAQYRASMDVLTSASVGKRTLKVGYTSELYHTLHLSEAFSAFLIANPNMKIMSEINLSETCEKKVFSRELDVAFVEDLSELDRIKHFLLMKERYFVLIHPEHILADKAKVQLQDLVSQSLIIADSASKSANNFLSLLDERKIEYQVVYRGG